MKKGRVRLKNILYGVGAVASIALLGVLWGYLMLWNDQAEEKQLEVGYSEIREDGVAILKEDRIWDYLHEDTPRLKFNTDDSQQLVFHKEASAVLDSIELNDKVLFPAVDKEGGILPEGWVVQVMEKEIGKDTYSLLVWEPEETRSYTVEEIEALLEEAEKEQAKKD